MPRAKNVTAKIEPSYSFGGAPFSRATNSPATKTTKSRDTDGNRRTETVDLKGDQNVKSDRLQLAKFRGFNQAKADDPKRYFTSNQPRCESEPDWSKFSGKEVR
jgi:hypothetical protein